MSLFITGDVHGDMNSLYNRIMKNHITAGDWLVILGDFGCIWDGTAPKNLMKIGRMTKANIFVVLGNHENYNMIEQLPHSYNEELKGEVWNAAPNVFIAYNAGGVYNICGKRILAINGADSTDKEQRTIDKSWWKQECLNYQQMNSILEVSTEQSFDYIFSHCTGSEIINAMWPMSYWQRSTMEKFLNEVYHTCYYNDAYFGHYHDEKDLGKYHCLYTNVIKLV